MKKIRWGIMGTAKIALERVIPAIQQGKHCEVKAIASRKLERAQRSVKLFGIEKAYDMYEKLLDDPNIDAVYIPLPNHLHVPWSIKTIKAGKHVLCEKPIGLNAVEVRELSKLLKNYPKIKIMEAFMYRHHLQWQWVKQNILKGKIGKVKTIQSFFSLYNIDPEDIKNKNNFGGGSLLHLGCYCISLSRLIFQNNPLKVCGIMQNDQNNKIDYLTSGILEFESGISSFTCSTQLTPYQQVTIFGTKGWIKIFIPFNPSPNEMCKVWFGNGIRIEEIIINACNQYTIQADTFSLAILENSETLESIKDALENMRVIDALAFSAKSRRWIEIKNDYK